MAGDKDKDYDAEIDWQEAGKFATCGIRCVECNERNGSPDTLLASAEFKKSKKLSTLPGAPTSLSEDAASVT